LLDLYAVRLRPDRNEARDPSFFEQRRNIGPNPVIIARFRPVLDQPFPRSASLDGSPEVGKSLGRHVGMPYHIMGRTDQFLFGEPTDRHESLIDERDPTFLVGPRHQKFIVIKFDLFIGYRAVVAHRTLR
jgi:hypothetical protein